MLESPAIWLGCGATKSFGGASCATSHLYTLADYARFIS